MNIESTTQSVPFRSRDGSKIQREGKDWEYLVADTFNNLLINDMTREELSFMNEIFIDKSINYKDVRKVDIKVIGGQSKVDAVLTITFLNLQTPDIHINLQLKSVPNSTQFSIGSACNFTKIFEHKYPYGGIAIKKMTGYGEYGELAARLDAGGDYNTRFLICELETIEREEFKGATEDSRTLKPIIEFIFYGQDYHKVPEYCLFPLKSKSKSPKEWKFFRYDRAIDLIMSKPRHLLCDIRSGEDHKKGIKLSYFNLKMKDAGLGKLNGGDSLQIMASPLAIYNDLLSFKK